MCNLLSKRLSTLMLIGTAALAITFSSRGATPRAPAGPSLGQKVVDFCRQHLGEQVGEGECAHLAGAALKAAGAKNRGPDNPNAGDYVWGNLVLTIEAGEGGPKTTGKIADLLPGDVIQFRDTKFAWKTRNGHYTQSAAHHTAVLETVAQDGTPLTMKVFEQNFNGKRFVMESTLRPLDLKEGWLRFYRPVAQ